MMSDIVCQCINTNENLSYSKKIYSLLNFTTDNSDVDLRHIFSNLELFEALDSTLLYRKLKRLFDFAFSLVVITLFSWLFILIAFLIKVDDPSAPVLFRQKRVGLNGRTFTMYKFRTMCVDAESMLENLSEYNEKDGPAFKIDNDPRITSIGKWLRKLSLDELPQFFNVLLGDISVVGPRPALPAEVNLYDDYQRNRLLIRPGITCYWQTRLNRDSISFDDWINLDLLYIIKCGFTTDIKLIIQTIGVVLTAQGK